MHSNFLDSLPTSCGQMGLPGPSPFPSWDQPAVNVPPTPSLWTLKE